MRKLLLALAFTCFAGAVHAESVTQPPSPCSSLGVTAGNCQPGTATPNYISGLILSTAGSSATFGVSSGAANDSTNVSSLVLASAYTKTTSAWAVGTGNGCLDTGTIANSTPYAVFLIQRVDTGVVDVICTKETAGSTPSPTLPSNYTLARYIWTLKTDGSAHWQLFTQTGNRCVLAAGTTVFNTTPGVAGTFFTMNAPLGLVTAGIIRGYAVDATPNNTALITSPQETSAASNATLGNITVTAQILNQSAPFGELAVLTNTSGQGRAIASDNALTLSIYGYGWIDLARGPQ